MSCSCTILVSRIELVSAKGLVHTLGGGWTYQWDQECLSQSMLNHHQILLPAAQVSAL